MTDRDSTAGTPPVEDVDASLEAAHGGLGRRLLVLRVAALGTAAATAAVPAAEALEPTPVQYRTGITDNDPSDGPGYGRGGGRPRTGITDNDPNDGPGYGRGYRARPQGRPYTGINDGDPNDPSGYGTGWRQRRGTGITDNDPNDSPGNGRGGYRAPRNVTDNDPNDAPGRGRGWR